MGREATCDAVINGRSMHGRALLETDELVFRGDQRLTIPYREMESVSAEQGRLTLAYAGGTAIFDLAGEAETWAHRILNPKTLIDKLGVRAGDKVVVLRLDDDDFVNRLRQRGARVLTRSSPEVDAIFFGAVRRSDLGRLPTLKSYLRPSGALWVVRPKGAAAISERDVLQGGKAAGLVDVKVVRFSDSQTAEKFMLPKAARR
jgi:hypothetical protein